MTRSCAGSSGTRCWRAGAARWRRWRSAPQGPRAAVGVLGGGLLAAVSYRAIKGAVDAAMDAQRRPAALVKFVTRHAILAVAAYVMLVRLRLHPIGILVGASSLVLAAAVAAARFFPTITVGIAGSHVDCGRRGRVTRAHARTGIRRCSTRSSDCTRVRPHGKAAPRALDRPRDQRHLRPDCRRHSPGARPRCAGARQRHPRLPGDHHLPHAAC